MKGSEAGILKISMCSPGELPGGPPTAPHFPCRTLVFVNTATLENERMLRDSELAQVLGVSATTVKWWRVQNRGPKWVKVGRSVFYRIADVRIWIDQLPTGGGVPWGARREASAGMRAER